MDENSQLPTKKRIAPLYNPAVNVEPKLTGRVETPNIVVQEELKTETSKDRDKLKAKVATAKREKFYTKKGFALENRINKRVILYIANLKADRPEDKITETTLFNLAIDEYLDRKERKS